MHFAPRRGIVLRRMAHAPRCTSVKIECIAHPHLCVGIVGGQNSLQGGINRRRTLSGPTKQVDIVAKCQRMRKGEGDDDDPSAKEGKPPDRRAFRAD